MGVVAMHLCNKKWTLYVEALTKFIESSLQFYSNKCCDSGVDASTAGVLVKGVDKRPQPCWRHQFVVLACGVSD
jgi:hypothetical protein